MKQARRFGLILPLISLIFASLACNMPAITSVSDANAPATATMPATATFVTQTSDTNGPSQNMETEGVKPTETQTPTPSPTPTLTPTITPTPTPSAPMVGVSIDTNCRFGPGDVYDYLGALLVGETSEVVGKNSSETFWYIRNLDPPPEFCWIWGYYAEVEGDTSSLPVLTPPPTPTPSPVPFAFQGKYADFISCTNYTLFAWIKNTGEVDLESFHLKVVDTTINQTKTNAYDSFATSVHCCPQTTQRLKPGEVGYAFMYHFQTISNHTFKATLKVCTEDALGGNCDVTTFTTTE
jgi:hypothetical protein